MPALTGINALVMFSQFDISTDLNRVTVNQSAEAPEKTTFQPPGRTRQRSGSGLKDWTISIDGLFNDESPSAVDALLSAALGGGSMLGTYFDATPAASQRGYEGRPREVGYNIESPVDGMVTMTAEFSGSGRLFRPYVVRSGSFEASGGSAVSDSIDLGASQSKLTGFLRLYREALGGSSLTVTLQDSSNDSVWSDLAAFAATSVSAFEILSTGSSKRYIRVATCPAGASGSATVFVSVAGD